MRKLTIYKRYFYESDCYNSGIQQVPVGVQVHSTGANNPELRRYVGPDDGRLGRNQYGNHSNKPGSTVCASAYIGRLADGSVACYQTLPWNYRCWLSAHGTNGNANKMGYVGFEICEDSLKNEAYFMEAVMGVSVNLTAYLCKLFGTTPNYVVKAFAQGDALAVMDHSELHALKLASNHADIRHWLKKYGLTMNDYRNAVVEAMEEGVEVTYVDCDESADLTLPVMYKAVVTPSGSYLNLRAAKSTSAKSLWKLRKGDVVEVLNDNDPDWWVIRVADDVTGFAMWHSGDAVWLQAQTGDDPVEQPVDPVVLYDAEVTPTGAYLNLRKGKSGATMSLAKLYPEEIVSVLDDSDPEWWMIRTGNGLIGYSCTGNGKDVWLRPVSKGQEVPVNPASSWSVTIHNLSEEEALRLKEAYPAAIPLQTTDREGGEQNDQ